MSSNLLDALNGLMTPDTVAKAASFMGESDASVSKGMGAVFPVLLSSLANRSSDEGLMSSVFKLATNPANDGGLLDNVSSLLSPNAASSPMGALGGQLLGSLFGNNTSNLANALGGYAGVKSSSAGSLLNFAAPLLLAALSKAVRSGNLSLSSLIGLFTGQKAAFSAALPGPLSNLQSYFSSPARETRAVPPPPPEPKKSPMRWLLPLIIALAALWLLSRCMGDRTAPVETVPAPVVESAPVVEPAPMPEAAPVVDAVPSAVLFFEVDQSALPANNDAELAGLVAYLLGNPSARVAVTGFHDPTGDLAHNEELAKNRALAVRDSMVAAGVDTGRIDLAKPMVTTGTGSLDEARRVEVRVNP